MRPNREIDQLAFVVRDFDKALEYWSRGIGVGPFMIRRDLTIPSLRYHGKATSVCIDVALGYWGETMIELIHQLNDAPSVYQEFLEEGREGLQHLGLLTSAYDHDLAHYMSNSYQAVQDGPGIDDPSTRTVYLEHKDKDGVMIELIETSEKRLEVFSNLRRMANDWNGEEATRFMTHGTQAATP